MRLKFTRDNLVFRMIINYCCTLSVQLLNAERLSCWCGGHCEYNNDDNNDKNNNNNDDNNNNNI